MKYVSADNWGHDWSSYAPLGLGSRPPISSLPISDLMPCPQRRRKPRIRNETCQSASLRL
jgi:hypothetical protein